MGGAERRWDIVTDRLRLATKRLVDLTDRFRGPQLGLVVLAYHRVGRRSDTEVDLSTGVFEAQMARLAQADRAIDLSTALHRLSNGEDLTGSVVVTFDDGTADFADEVVPVIDCYQVPVTLYVATAHIEDQLDFPDDGVPLSWRALADCVSTGLVTVGSHTHTHTLMDRIDQSEAAQELDRSIQLIGERLDLPVEHFAYPKAVAPSVEVQALVRLRFRSAALAGTRPNPPGTDLHRLSRSPVQVSDGMQFFERKIEGGMALEGDLRQLLNRRRYASLSR